MYRKNIILLISILTAGCMLCACGTPAASGDAAADGTGSEAGVSDSETAPDTIPVDPGAVEDTASELDNVISEDEASSVDYYGDYVEVGGSIAYVTGVSEIDDTNYNTAVFDGIKTYATGAGVSYSYYIAEADTDEAYKDAIMKAVDNNAVLVVCSGYHFNTTVGEIQNSYPDVSFLMVDGEPTDADGNDVEIASNVHCISFDEQESGYLAGYMTALDGYTSFGFIGGENVPAVADYGIGFLQGINDACESIGNSANVEVNYWYSGTFLPEDRIYNTAADWYANDGTQIIFSCGGSIYESILKAADQYDGRMIGVDIDQSDISDRFLTSAMKGVDRAVVIALDDYFAYGGWSEEMAGQMTDYGIEEHCSSLPTGEWRFANVTLEDYDSLSGLIKSGLITICDSEDESPDLDIDVHYYTADED